MVFVHIWFVHVSCFASGVFVCLCVVLFSVSHFLFSVCCSSEYVRLGRVGQPVPKPSLQPRNLPRHSVWFLCRLRAGHAARHQQHVCGRARHPAAAHLHQAHRGAARPLPRPPGPGQVAAAVPLVCVRFAFSLSVVLCSVFV